MPKVQSGSLLFSSYRVIVTHSRPGNKADGAKNRESALSKANFGENRGKPGKNPGKLGRNCGENEKYLLILSLNGVILSLAICEHFNRAPVPWGCVGPFSYLFFTRIFH
jgi:hypothetical protein